MEEETDQRFLEHEAPFSINTFVRTPNGFRAQITIRHLSWEAGVAEFEDMVGFLLDQGYAPGEGAVTHDAGDGESGAGKEGWCPIHNAQMRRWEKNGKTWHSHRVGPGKFCRGRQGGEE